MAESAKRQPRDLKWDLSSVTDEKGRVKNWEGLTVILLEASIFVNGKVG